MTMDKSHTSVEGTTVDQIKLVRKRLGSFNIINFKVDIRRNPASTRLALAEVDQSQLD